jgi:Flp pilus assembly protein TadD
MIVCPACHAENPDGTKICVKCATELPKAVPAAAKGKTPAAPSKGFGMRDIGRDMVDFLWLLLIICLIFVGFLWEATNGSWHFTETEEAKIMEPVIKVVKAPVHHGKAVTSHPADKAVEPAEPISEKPTVPSGSAENFYQKGKTEYDRQRYQTSFNYLRQSLEIDPTYAKAYFGLGYLYSRFEMNDAAVRMYEMALRFDPNHVDSINNLAMMYYRAGNSDDALDLLQKASALESQNADVQYNLGSIYLEKNQPDAALQAFQKASTLRPDDATIYNDMALTYEKLGKKSEAQDAWQKVMQYSKNAVLLQQAKTHLDFLQTQS